MEAPPAPPPALSVLSFTVEPLPRRAGPPGPLTLGPVVDGISLITRVGRFERSRGHDVAGDYGGIVPAWFRYGDLRTYYLGAQGDDQWPGPGRAWLLGCSCGEVGCWPLEAEVAADATTVVWSGFRQCYRKARDYTGFGPFVFERGAYEAAVDAAVRSLGRDQG